MKHKIFFSAIFLYCLATSFGFYAHAQVVGFDAQVKEYGQLKSVLGENWDKIDSLAVSGPIDATDFRTMWECAFYGKLTILNLENAQVENKTIPKNAFFDPDIQIWETPYTLYLGIRKIILPDDIVEIGFAAFDYMKLEEINLPASLRKLNQFSFGHCHWLRVDPLVIPEGITEIPNQCFTHCQSFKKLVLPSSLRIIDTGAFYDTRIEEVVFPENLDSIGVMAFEGCIPLRKAILPDNCTKIGYYAFFFCDSLREIHIPNEIEYIPSNLVGQCFHLEKANIPESVTEIRSNAFYYCSEFKEIKLPNKLQYIGEYAFYCCNPDSVVFPLSLQYIGEWACGGWKNAQKIFSISPTPPTASGNAFNGAPTEVPVYVPVGSAELYRNAQGWNYFTNFVETDQFPSAGIYGVKTDAPLASKVYWSSGYLNIELFDMPDNPIPYAIYTLEGRLAESGKLNSRNFATQLPKGFYIVQVGKDVHKVR